MRIEATHAEVSDYTLYVLHASRGERFFLASTWDCGVQGNQKSWWWRKNLKKGDSPKGSVDVKKRHRGSKVRLVGHPRAIVKGGTLHQLIGANEKVRALERERDELAAWLFAERDRKIIAQKKDQRNSAVALDALLAQIWHSEKLALARELERTKLYDKIVELVDELYEVESQNELQHQELIGLRAKLVRAEELVAIEREAKALRRANAGFAAAGRAGQRNSISQWLLSYLR